MAFEFADPAIGDLCDRNRVEIVQLLAAALDSCDQVGFFQDRDVFRDGDVVLSWIRRARKDGDRWAAGEPPVEGVEGYRIRVSGGESVREWDVPATTGTRPLQAARAASSTRLRSATSRAQNSPELPSGEMALAPSSMIQST